MKFITLIIILTLVVSNTLSQKLILTTDIQTGWTVTVDPKPMNISPLINNTDWLVDLNEGILSNEWIDLVEIANIASTQITVNNNVGNNSKPIWRYKNNCMSPDLATETIQYNFRNTFRLEDCQEIKNATLRYACDNLSRIYINGKQIVSGNGFYQYPGINLECSSICGVSTSAAFSVPAGTNFNSRPFDVVEIADIKSLLQPGINVIAMEIINTGGCAINFGWINANLEIDLLEQPVSVIVEEIIHKNCYNNGSIILKPIAGKSPFKYILNQITNETGEFYNLLPGIYDVTIMDANNCKSYLTFEIKDEGIIPKLKIENLDNIIDCSDTTTSIVLSASGGEGIKISLDNGSMTDTLYFNNLNPGQHSIIAVNSFGCISDTINFEIFSYPNNEFQLIEKTFCRGDSINIMGKIYDMFGIFYDTIPSQVDCDTIFRIKLIEKISSINYLYKTLCFGESYKVGQSSYNETGQYLISLDTPSSCDSLINLNIIVLDDKSKNLFYSICQGDTIRIGEELFIESGIFSKTLTTSSGCDSVITLKIDFKDDEVCENGSCGRFVIPNVFTPNNDGINDYFEVNVKNAIISYMVIFNRWGGVVYESHDINPSWDGYFLGREVENGVYVYMIRGQCTNNLPIFKYGDVTVVR